MPQGESGMRMTGCGCSSPPTRRSRRPSPASSRRCSPVAWRWPSGSSTRLWSVVSVCVRRERYDAFRVAFLAVAGELLGPDDLVPAQRVDLELPLGLVSDELEKLIRYLEPCGPGNPAPVFGVRQARAVGARRVGTNHLRF